MGVTRFEITSRQPFADGVSFGDAGPYEQLEGKVEFAFDPDAASNAAITDIELAERGADGLVHASSDFRILRAVDPARRNRRLLHDILNRGRYLPLRIFNGALSMDPAEPLQPGNGFLMRHGYTVSVCGWQMDIPDTPGLMGMRGPDAFEADGRPVSGRVAVTFQPNSRVQSQLLSDRNHQPYVASDLDDTEAVLLVRAHEDAPAQTVPRGQWSFSRVEGGKVAPDGRYVTLDGGFEPGCIYTCVYATSGAPVLGLGLLGTRDFVSFLRHGSASEGNPCAGEVDFAIGSGASQSGRFLRQFMYLDLNDDESGRRVFDGLFVHIAGGRRGEFNQRFGQPSSFTRWSSAASLPFADIEAGGGLLARAAARGALPKIMYVNSSVEYWGGHAAFIHADVEGTRDLELLDSVRSYHMAGTQHATGAWPLSNRSRTDDGHGALLFNCVDHGPLVRGALIALDEWVSMGQEPPPSAVPRLDDRTLATVEAVRETFPAIPGVEFPAHPRGIGRLDFGPEVERGILSTLPPVEGEVYPRLVSAVDADGNEIGGVRSPEVSVPLATHTGWNPRHPDTGGRGQVVNLAGSSIPFARTQAEREATGDPRPSIEERYASKADYRQRVEAAARKLVVERRVLDEDVADIVAQAGERYDALGPRQ